MNPYALMAARAGTPTSTDCATRLAAWHDAMVAHERRLRSGRTNDACEDECPHVQAETLWGEALVAFGTHAHELSFLRSRATRPASPAARAVA